MRSSDFDGHDLFLAKAHLIAEAGIAARLPRNRVELKDHLAEIRRRIRTRDDRRLAAFGLSRAGIRHYFETVCGASEAQSAMLADAAIELIQRYDA
jgi:hypothetical protein